MKDIVMKEKFIEMRARNISFDKISEALKVNKNTLVSWSKELQIEVSNMRALELEKLQELYLVSKEKRIQVFGEKLQEILQELETRNLQEVDTVKLLELMIKYGELLKKEEASITLKENVVAGLINKWEV